MKSITYLLFVWITIQNSQATPVGHEESNQVVLNLIADANQIANPNESKKILAEALSIKHHISDSVKCALYAELGIVYGKMYQADSTKYYFHEVLSIAESQNWQILKIKAYNGLGNTARSESNNDLAMDLFSKGIEMASQDEEMIFRHWECMLYGAIAGIYYDLGDYQQALKVMKKSLDLGFVLGDGGLISTNYTRMGYLYTAMGQTEKAIDNTLKARPYLIELQDTLGLIYHYQALGGAYSLMKEYEQALTAFRACLALADQFSEEEIKTGTLLAIGKIYLAIGQWRMSRDLAAEVIQNAKTNHLLGKLKDGYQLLSDLERKQGNYKKALAYSDQYHAIADSIGNAEIQSRINELNTKYETEKKEREIASLYSINQLAEAELSKKRVTQSFLSLLALILLVACVYIYLNQKEKNKLKQQALLGEMSELRLQIKELLGKYEGQVDIEMGAFNKKLVNPLSEREFEIFKKIFTQKTNREIADEVFVSVNTVKTHLKNIYSKLGVSNRREALETVLKQTP